MLEEHWRVWTCPFGYASSLTCSSDIRRHLTEMHGTDASEDETHYIISLDTQFDLKQSEGMCPLCQNFEMKSDSRGHSYETHVGHHLEQLALFILPHQDDNDEAGDLDNDKTLFQRVRSLEDTSSKRVGPHSLGLGRGSSDDGLLRELGPRS